MSEYTLRRQLEALEQKGIIVRQIGRGGTALTPKGRAVFERMYQHAERIRPFEKSNWNPFSEK